MALHLNDYGLRQEGYTLVAVYECFKRWYFDDETHKWRWFHKTVKCYKHESGACLIRQIDRRIWDDVYYDSNKANAVLKAIFNDYDSHKRTF